MENSMTARQNKFFLGNNFISKTYFFLCNLAGHTNRILKRPSGTSGALWGGCFGLLGGAMARY